jgi:hypothetical protein
VAQSRRPGLAVHRPGTVARGARLPSLRSAPARPAVLHRVLGLRPTVNGETLQTAQAPGPTTRLHATKDGPGSTQPPAQTCGCSKRSSCARHQCRDPPASVDPRSRRRARRPQATGAVTHSQRRGSGFSTDRLIEVVRHLGRDIEVVVSNASWADRRVALSGTVLATHTSAPTEAIELAYRARYLQPQPRHTAKNARKSI